MVGRDRLPLERAPAASVFLLFPRQLLELARSPFEFVGHLPLTARTGSGRRLPERLRLTLGFSLLHLSAREFPQPFGKFVHLLPSLTALLLLLSPLTGLLMSFGVTLQGPPPAPAKARASGAK